jgi:hypothetical protein
MKDFDDIKMHGKTIKKNRGAYLQQEANLHLFYEGKVLKVK